jgi:hypothetical protein
MRHFTNVPACAVSPLDERSQARRENFVVGGAAEAAGDPEFTEAEAAIGAGSGGHLADELADIFLDQLGEDGVEAERGGRRVDIDAGLFCATGAKVQLSEAILDPFGQMDSRLGLTALTGFHHTNISADEAEDPLETSELRSILETKASWCRLIKGARLIGGLQLVPYRG